MNEAENIAALSKQILGSSDTSKWTGAGFGSAQANADFMARLLSQAGITDISQFAQAPAYTKVDTIGYTYAGSPARQYTDDSGQTSWLSLGPDGWKPISPDMATAIKPVYGTTQYDENGPSYTPVDQSKVTMVNGVPSMQTGTQYINKATGQVVGRDDLDWNQQGAWAGTYAGEGKTAMGVQFDAQGNPHFYTQFGGDTSNMGDIAPILNVAIAFVAPYLGPAIAAELAVSEAVGTAIASTALQVAAGVDPQKALENAVTSAVIQTGSSTVASEINTAVSQVVSDPKLSASISNAAGSALASGATAAAKGGSTQDIITSAVSGAAGSATTAATGEAALGGAVSGGITGGTMGAITGAAGALGKSAATPAPTTTTSDATLPQDLSGSQAAQLAYNIGIEQGLSPEEARAKALALAGVSGAETKEAFLPAAVYGGIALSPAIQALAGAGAVGVTGGIGWLMSLIGGQEVAASEQDKQVGKLLVDFINANPTANSADITASLQQLFPDVTQDQIQQIQQRQADLTSQIQDQLPEEMVITAKKIPTEAETPAVDYKPEITTPPTTIVAAVDETGKKALVYDSTGVQKIIDVPPNVTVTPGQSVSVDSQTNQIVAPSSSPSAGGGGGGGGGGGAPAGGGAAPATGAGITSSTTPGGDTGAGGKQVSGTVADTGSETGTDGGSGAGVGPGAVAGKGTGTGTGVGSGKGSGVGSGTGTGVGSGVGSGVGEGIGSGVGPGEGTGEGAGGSGEAGGGAGGGAGGSGGVTDYKPSITTSYTTTPKASTSALAQALQGQYYPLSTTGLTAYRPAGEIESEESGKGRQDVWNEASLRLKDALGL